MEKICFYWFLDYLVLNNSNTKYFNELGKWL